MIRASRPAPLLRITAVLAIAACLRWDRSGTVEAYEPCRYLKDCAAGLRCVRWIGSGGAICSPTCSLEAECLLPEGFATLHATCHSVGVCLVHCSAASDRCPAGLACRQFDDGRFGYCAPE